MQRWMNDESIDMGREGKKVEKETNEGRSNEEIVENGRDG